MFLAVEDPSASRTRLPRLAWQRQARPSRESASRSTGPRRPVNLTSDPAQLEYGPDSTGPRTPVTLTAERGQVGRGSKPKAGPCYRPRRRPGPGATMKFRETRTRSHSREKRAPTSKRRWAIRPSVRRSCYLVRYDDMMHKRVNPTHQLRCGWDFA